MVPLSDGRLPLLTKWMKDCLLARRPATSSKTRFDSAEKWCERVVKLRLAKAPKTEEKAVGFIVLPMSPSRRRRPHHLNPDSIVVSDRGVINIDHFPAPAGLGTPSQGLPLI